MALLWITLSILPFAVLIGVVIRRGRRNRRDAEVESRRVEYGRG